MNKIINKVVAIALLIVIGACSDDNDINTNESVVNIDTQVAQNEFDKYLEETFTKPYNIEFVYKWKDIESDMNYALVPAGYKNSVKMANLVKYLCLDAYDAVAPEGFLKKYFPKMIMLVGSSAYKNNGNTILGTAEGGLKITLYNINNLKPNNVQKLFYYYFQTIYHEFSHILHQTTDYTTDFDKISAVDYRGDAWSNVWGSEEAALKRGFISEYSSKEPNEDFVELIAHYVTNTEESWAKKIEPAGEEGKAILNQKMSIVKSYLKDVWQIDIDELRAEITKRANNLENQDLDKITL